MVAVEGEGQRQRVGFLRAVIRNWRTALAVSAIRRAARREAGYAHAWYGQVAACAAAAGCSPEQASDTARRFCLRAFGVETQA